MNATHLFEKPFRQFHNSESWWSTFFSLFALEESNAKDTRPLPVWRYLHHNRYWCSGAFDVSGLNFGNVVVEGSLCAQPFRLPIWPPEYLALKVDIVMIRDRHTILVEAKTIGASIAKNLLLYVGLTNHLRSKGWDADFYHLISYGHEIESDWKLISDHGLEFFMWEDVLRLASTTAVGQTLGIDLSEYTDLPPNSGAPGANP